MKRNLISGIALMLLCVTLQANKVSHTVLSENMKEYKGDYLNYIAFPIGGMGAGMFCLEGTGAISHMSVRHQPDVFNEPCMFAAINVKGYENGCKILEGPVPDYKKFGRPGSTIGAPFTSYGLPRFDEVSFSSRFPFAYVRLSDEDLPLFVELKGWSPFIPTDQDNSSLPVGAIEYVFTNTSDKDIEAIFSYNSVNFMKMNDAFNSICRMDNGFILTQYPSEQKDYLQGEFAIYTDAEQTRVNYCWFRGGWWDPLTMVWNDLVEGRMSTNDPIESDAPGVSLYVPFTVKAKSQHTIRLYMAWFIPTSNLRYGDDAVVESDKSFECPTVNNMETPYYYRPWYSTRFTNINEVTEYWLSQYDDLKNKTELFSSTFYNSTLPAEVVEAVAANLSILKSPTIMRQHDGRMWNYEGCGDTWGACHGSCTHVWNYAQAIPHLFPEMERTLRETEFFVSQNEQGHQMFRTNLPIRPVSHNFYAAADGQLGGIIKVYRDWRISGDTEWLRMMFPQVRTSMDYCIETWDPRHTGALEEPHHNTYDIEFWGADGMCTSIYAAALNSMVKLGTALGEDVSEYASLFVKSKNYLENQLYNGEYFIQNIQYNGLKSPDPITMAEMSWNSDYSVEARELLVEEGPKYQYGSGCLSDGVIGCWMSLVAGLESPVDPVKVKSHLNAVYKYNFRRELKDHANPQRPSYALGSDGGLLLCTWPVGGKLSLPFVYCDEVWTGIEYQVASHLIFAGEIEKGLDIVRTVRKRYDGKVRNPFNEYEYGSWYARALSSYSLLQALTGIRYDAVEKTLYINPKIGKNFKSFLSTNTGFGTVELKRGKPIVTIAYGDIDIQNCVVLGKKVSLQIFTKD